MGPERRIAVVAALLLAVFGLVGTAISVPASAERVLPASTGQVGPGPATRVASKAAPPFTPRTGVTMNDPIGDRHAKNRIRLKLIDTIDSVPRHGHIKILSWNVRSPIYERALIRANQRGVSVQVLMYANNRDPAKGNRNPGWNHMVDMLKKRNHGRRADMVSWAHVCHASCRGQSGMAHAKFFLFDRAGAAQWVTIHGSANLTDLANSNQWNDILTVRSQALYTFMVKAFNQMKLDRPVPNPLLTGVFGQLTMNVLPWHGPSATVDPVIGALRKVKCTGATGGTGVRGHTLIRIAQTATHGDRGNRIADEMVSLAHQGCQFRFVYTLLGNEIMGKFRKAGIRFVQIVKDENHDYIYENYLHSKVMTISGNYNGVTDSRMVWDGSHNWTGLSLVSDETFAEVRMPGVFPAYNKWIDQLYFHPPYKGPALATAVNGRVYGIDPYALVEED